MLQYSYSEIMNMAGLDGHLTDAQIKNKILKHLSTGTYRLTKHAAEEQKNDDLDLPDVERVLKTGVHEREKTRFINTHQTWNYAIRGKTEDLREVRVIVVFSEEMIIITVMELCKKKKKRSHTKG